MDIERCTICMNSVDMESDPTVHTTSCGHNYHQECINAYINYKTNNGEDTLCPNCKTPIMEIERYKEFVDVIECSRPCFAFAYCASLSLCFLPWAFFF